MMYNALQALQEHEFRQRTLAGMEADRASRNQLMQFNMQRQAQQDALARQQFEHTMRSTAQRNMLAQQMMGSRERLMREQMGARERMAREKLNQPFWDNDRGVFIPRPQSGQGGVVPGAAGVFAPPGLPPRRNPEAEKLQAKAAFQLPEALNQGEMALRQIDEMIGSEDGKVKAHPGFESSVGATWLPGARFIEGSPQADFMARLNQAKGGAFLQAFESLKGGGQITEVEGKKATEAITRMDKAQSEKEFRASAREFQGIIRKAMENAKKQAAPRAAPAAETGQFKVLGVEGR